MSLKSKCDQYDTLVKELFRILDVTEESDEGRVLHPVQVACHRSYLLKELEEVLSLLKLTMEDKA